MGGRHAPLTFAPRVKDIQESLGSRKSYAILEAKATGEPYKLTARESEFLSGGRSFYLATVSEDDWPYVQHRGGPVGFLRVLDDRRLAVADFSGNKLYITAGELAGNDRVSLFVMHYANRRCLKIMGRAQIVDPAADPVLAAQVGEPGEGAPIERIIIITGEAFDWNCNQYITQRFAENELAPVLAPYLERIATLEAELTARTDLVPA